MASIVLKPVRAAMEPRAIKRRATVIVPRDTQDSSARKDFVPKISTEKVATRRANARLKIPKLAIHMTALASASQAGAAQLAIGHVHSLNMARVVPSSATAKTMRSACRQMERAFARRVTQEPSAKSLVRLERTVKIAPRDASARTMPNVIPRQDSVSAKTDGPD
jgi:hypothetical protein